MVHISQLGQLQNYSLSSTALSMEKTNKMKSLTNDMKNFEKLMQEQRKEKQVPEIEIEIDTEEDSPADILLQAAGMLMDCSVMVAKAAFLVGLM